MPNAKTTSKTKPRPYILGPADDAILQAVARFHFLTAKQVTRLLYSPGSFTTVSSRMKALTDHDYLQRVLVPTTAGNAPSVATLTRKGMIFLSEHGFEPPNRARPAENKEHSYLFFAHTLAINDFLIATELLCRQQPAIVPRLVLHERVLKRRPIAVDDGEGGTLAVIPDAYVDLAIAGQYRVCFSLELDRGSEEQKKWRRKVRALVHYANGPYQATFGTDALTVLVVATPGQKRLVDLVRWTEAELTALNQEQTADLFRFATFPLASASGQEIYFQPWWYTPFNHQPDSLLTQSMFIEEHGS